MSHYRCFFVSDLGMIMKAEIISAGDDAEAIGKAKELLRAEGAGYRGFELWQLDRIVHQWRGGDG